MRFIPATLLLAGIPLAAAQTPPMLDRAALPPMDPAGTAAYENFLLGNLPRAFAISGNRKYGAHWGGTNEAARAAALKSCADKGGTGCAIYAEDLQVSWPGRPVVAPRPPPGPLLSGTGWAFVPDDRYFWQGPGAAQGVVVFAHGFSGNASQVEAGGLQPPPYIRAFNNAGYDVVRFAREYMCDYRADEMAQHLRDGLKELRRRGWKHIVLTGQSRGAWNSLQTLDTPGLSDAVIAISPAANGTASAQQVLLGNPALWRIIGNVDPSQTRVAFVQFHDDPFYTDGDARVAILRHLQDKAAALLIIDRPDGLTGHAAGNSPTFAMRYAACLLHFATAPTPPAGC